MPNSKQRRQAERRRLERRLRRRAQRQAARRRYTLIASIVGTLVVAAIVVGFVLATTGEDKTPSGHGSGSASPHSSAATSPTPTASSSSAINRTLDGSCTFTKSGTAARKVALPKAKQPTKGTVKIAVTTNRGDMTFTLDRSKAPCTVGSFVSLVKQKFYDKTPCPRVESSNLFILQCGDPTGTGSGGPGYTVPDEYTGKEKYTAGVLAMANTGSPNTGGSQFFIVYKPDQLPAQYTIFGKVTSGLDVVTKVAAGGNDGSNQAGGGKPKLPINLTKLAVQK